MCQVMWMKARAQAIATVVVGLALVGLLAYGDIVRNVPSPTPSYADNESTFATFGPGFAVPADVPAVAADTSADPKPAGGPGGSAGYDSSGGSGGSASDPEASGASCSCGDVHKLWYEDVHMVGDQVAELQQGLAVAGFYRGAVDGVFGPATREALMGFQSSVGLEPTGVADMSTWMALGRVCEPIVEKSIKNPDPEAQTQIVSAQADAASSRVILIDTSDLTLTVLENGLPIARFRVGIGEPKTPTPVGHFRITDKAAWAGGFGTRWMGLNVPWGRYGIHGTNKPWTVGQRKSSGCVRMLNRDVEKLYSMVSVGTPVVITAGHIGIYGTDRPLISPGWKGSMVAEIQRRLIRMGYLEGNPDGAYGPNTERAIIKLQKDNGLPATGKVDMATYRLLGLDVID